MRAGFYLCIYISLYLLTVDLRPIQVLLPTFNSMHTIFFIYFETINPWLFDFCFNKLPDTLVAL